MGWGNNNYGQLAGQGSFVSQPVIIQTPYPVSKFAVGDAHTIILDSQGILRGCGLNDQGQLGITNTTTNQYSAWQTITEAYDDTFGTSTTSITMTGLVDVFAGGDSSFFTIGSNKDLYSTGDNTGYQLGRKTASSYYNFSYIVQRADITLAIDNNGYLYGWGKNYEGQLDTYAAAEYVKAPVKLGTDQWNMVATNGSVVLAIDTNGRLWSWGSVLPMLGRTASGQNATKGEISAGSGLTWTAVCCGANHVIATKSNGTLWAWGVNQRGCFGTGNVNDTSTTPVQVGTSTNWSTGYFTHIACGYDTSYIINSSGKLYAWGANDKGQVANGTTTDRYTPYNINSSQSYSQVSAYPSTSAKMAIALNSSGTHIPYAWGYNLNSLVGTGASGSTYYTSPQEVPTGYTNTFVSVGSYGVAITTAEGYVFVWGNNANGRLGLSSSYGSVTYPIYLLDLTDNYVTASRAFAGNSTMFITVGNSTNAAGYNTSYGHMLGLGELSTPITSQYGFIPLGGQMLASGNKFRSTGKNSILSMDLPGGSTNNAKYAAAKCYESFLGYYVNVWGSMGAGSGAPLSDTYLDHSPFRWEGKILQNMVGESSTVAATDTVLLFTSVGYYNDAGSFTADQSGYRGSLTTWGISNGNPLNSYKYESDKFSKSTIRPYSLLFAAINTKDYPFLVGGISSMEVVDVAAANITNGDKILVWLENDHRLHIRGTSSVSRVNDLVGDTRFHKLGTGGFTGLLRVVQS